MKTERDFVKDNITKYYYFMMMIYDDDDDDDSTLDDDSPLHTLLMMTPHCSVKIV